jgi:hypothetical protein
MRNNDLPLADRFAAAQAALPLVHPKKTTGRSTGASADEYGYDRCEINWKHPYESTARVPATRESNRIATKTRGADLSPLDFFLEAMRDPNTPFHLRTKAARIVAPYVHPKLASRKPELVIDDPYGFVVDSEAARALRDAHRHFMRSFQTVVYRKPGDRQHFEAWKRFKSMEFSLGCSMECPAAYTSVDEDNDLTRRDELYRKWLEGTFPHQLTPEEDAEEAHLYARIAAFQVTKGRATSAPKR